MDPELLDYQCVLTLYHPPAVIPVCKSQAHGKMPKIASNHKLSSVAYRIYSVEIE